VASPGLIAMMASSEAHCTSASPWSRRLRRQCRGHHRHSSLQIPWDEITSL
jgi:hypothetical protein